MLFRNRIVRIEHVNPESKEHGKFRVDRQGTIYLSIDRTFSVGEILVYLREHWESDVLKSGLIKRSKRTFANKILEENPKMANWNKHVKAKSKTKYHNNYPSQKARIIYTPM